MKRHIDVAAIIALAIIAAFIAAYFRSPDNATLEGALVTAFAAAWGFFLGSSHGARASREQLGRIADRAAGGDGR